MKNWWQQLEERERLLVSVMTPLLLVALFFWGLWQPLHQHLDEARLSVQSQKKLLNWTRQSVVRVQAAAGSAANQGRLRGSLSQVVSTLAKQQQVDITRLQPQGQMLDVRIDTVPFERFVNFSQALEAQGVYVEQLNLAASDTPGSVKVRSLRLGGGA